MPACETSCGGFKARPSEFATSKRTRGVLPPKRMAQEPVIKIHYHSFNVRIDFRLISKIYIYIRNVYIYYIYYTYIYIYYTCIYIYICFQRQIIHIGAPRMFRNARDCHLEALWFSGDAGRDLSEKDPKEHAVFDCHVYTFDLTAQK